MRRLTLFLSLPALLAAAAPATRDLSLPVPGGRTLTGTLSLPEGRGKHPVVILAHPFNAGRDGWAPLAEKLNARGIATLALDLPVEGADQLPAELALAAAWTKKQKDLNGRRLGLAGAGEGAVAAFLAAGKVHPDTLLALSPSGADAFGADTQARMVSAATRSHSAMMVFVSEGDKEAVDNAAPLKPLLGANVRTFEGSQRGFDYLKDHSDVMAVFFAEYLLHPHMLKAGPAPEKPQEGAPASTVLTPPPAQP